MLELYGFEMCSGCQKVRRALDDLGVDYIHRSVPKDRTKRNRVEEISGQPYVPVLVDPEHGKVIVNEDEIVNYLRTTYAQKA